MKLPPYQTFPTIKNHKISLREIENEDINHLIEISYYDGIQAQNLDEATEMQVKITKDYLNGDSIHWCITDNLTNDIVGTCGFYRGFANGQGELGCVLLPKYRGKGFMNAALLLAIDFGLKVMLLERIYAVTTLENKNAVKLLEKLNFIKVRHLEINEIEFELSKS